MMLHGLISYMEFTQFSGQQRQSVNALVNYIKGSTTTLAAHQKSRWEDVSFGIYRYLAAELGIEIPYVELHTKRAKDAKIAKDLIERITSRLNPGSDTSIWRTLPMGNYAIVGGNSLEKIISSGMMSGVASTIHHKAYALLAIAQWINIGQKAYLSNLVENDLSTRLSATKSEADAINREVGWDVATQTYDQSKERSDSIEVGTGVAGIGFPRSLIEVDEGKVIPIITSRMSKLKLRKKGMKPLNSKLRGFDKQSGIFVFDAGDMWFEAYKTLVISHPKMRINNKAALPVAVSKIQKTLRLMDTK